MANSVLKIKGGPMWPLGFIGIVTPGTPVLLSSYIDPNNYNAPGVFNAAQSDEYVQARFNQIMIQAIKPGATHGWQRNVGNVYVLMSGDGTGSANRDDQGVLIAYLEPGQNYIINPSAQNRDVYSPYSFWVDGDTAADGVTVLGILQ